MEAMETGYRHELDSLKDQIASRDRVVGALKADLAGKDEEMRSVEERHERDLEELTERYEEEQVVEFNLLDAEMEALKEERSLLEDKLAEAVGKKKRTPCLSQTNAFNVSIAPEEEEVDKEETEAERLLSEQLGLVGQLKEERERLEKRLEELEARCGEEREGREVLERHLFDMSTLLDDTQYNMLPDHVR